ncbi:hypothetical protein BJ138DRAFT_1103882 [Hygrophoropsis aurantiaca]|uniref:Uncharacterized protein n=1 Tax=Hygrophoropsis aurantiaca TaxID=72124 RepID=A0ACB8A3Q0_9AGAM|nr:hypothetical protein BJ138DRAFT_1103882 [Hygrophoropsis aurantiaca]
MYRQLVAFAAVSFAGFQGAFAQGNSSVGVCLGYTGFNWTVNSLNQDPCQVANNLFAADPCNQHGITFPPLTGPSARYAAPSADQQTKCTCNTVIYSLASACGLCQNATFFYWSQWIDQCSADNTVYFQWPASIPADTAIPPWAYMPLFNGQWSNVQGSINASAVQALPSTSASSSTATSSTAPSAATATSAAPASSASTTAAPAGPTGASTGGAGKMTASVGGAFTGTLLLSFLEVF